MNVYSSQRMAQSMPHRQYFFCERSRSTSGRQRI